MRFINLLSRSSTWPAKNQKSSRQNFDRGDAGAHLSSLIISRPLSTPPTPPHPHFIDAPQPKALWCTLMLGSKRLPRQTPTWPHALPPWACGHVRVWRWRSQGPRTKVHSLRRRPATWTMARSPPYTPSSPSIPSRTRPITSRLEGRLLPAPYHH